MLIKEVKQVTKRKEVINISKSMLVQREHKQQKGFTQGIRW